MRRKLFTGALVISLIGSGVAFASTGTSRATRPDLVVSSVSNPPAVTFPGHRFSVTDRTRNVGGAGARSTVTRYYLSSNGKRTAIGRRSIVSLMSGSSSRGSASATVPVTIQPGTYSLIACADARGAVREANERNNCRTAAATVIVKKLPPPV